MKNPATLLNAIDDLRTRTLSHIPSALARLVYLASTRDYNTGAYSHDGLAFRYTQSVAGLAIEFCHEEIFEKLSHVCLEDFVAELDRYIKSTKEDPAEIVRSWSAFTPYQLLTPRGGNGAKREYFISKIKFSLAVLQVRWNLPGHGDIAA